MRKRVGYIVCFILLTIGLVGCGSTFETKESAVFVKENGTVVEASVEEFSADYYNKDDLKKFVEESIERYTKENGKGSVKLSELTVEDKLATLYLEYESGKDFAKFSGEDFFCGTMTEAMAEGYSFGETYYKVKDSKIGKQTTISDMDEEELQVVIMKQRMGVKIEGSICYVSDNVTVTDVDTVSPLKDDDGKTIENMGDDYIVVIYK